MKLPDLLKYNGRNPRPDDFDEFWDRSLAEMQAIDPEVELKPAKFQAPGAECYDLFFTGVGGARVHAKYLRPRGIGGGKLPAVLMFHGYSGSSGNWFDKLAWAGQGFCIAALDCRGQGGMSEDKGGVRGNTHRGHIIRGLDEDAPEKLLFRQIFLDTAELARIVMSFPEVDAERVGASGGSQGGGLTLACAALEPRIRKAAATFPFLCDYLRVWEMDLAAAAYEEIKTYFRLFDPRHERQDEVFRKLGYIDVQHLAPRIKADVIMAVGMMDTVCPPSSQFAAYNKMKCRREYVLYPDFSHEELPGHADRVFRFMAEMKDADA
ncbi:MAG TPA: acetylxylan esterase [Planctomycetes bacterium]|nr:acetylxylan esterase [Planctomycetota bacterium]